MKLSVNRKRIRTLAVAAMLLGCLAGCKSAPKPVTINEENFPDASFREFVSNSYDLDSNGVLSPSEISAVIEMDVSLYEISDLKGIEVFSELMDLVCSANQLTELDISQNRELRRLNCEQNQLAKLDVSKNTKLTYLDCRFNRLEELDVSKNAELSELGCTGNLLTALSLTGNPRLDSLECNDNRLTELDLTKNRILNFMTCSNNQLDRLNVTQNPSLSWLHCDGNPLKELDVSRCDPNIRIKADDGVYIDNADKEPDKGIAIDETHFPGEGFREYVLDEIDSDKNGILSEREANSVSVIYFLKESVEDLKGLEYFPNLTFLHCSNNEISNLDLSANTFLQYLDCGECNLTELDLSKNSELIDVSCNSNQLKKLDFRKNKRLETLDCRDNPLTDLDIRNASKRLVIKVDSRDDLVVHTPDGKKSGSSIMRGSRP